MIQNLVQKKFKKKVNELIQQLAKALGEDNWQDLKIRLGFEFVDDNVKDYEDTINRFKSDASDSSSKELDSLNKQLDEQIQSLTDAKENLQNEYGKISDWGLDDYADQIKNNTIQTKFGNVDMDKRTIIHWSDELKQTYADALASWDYDPEVGSIDTVFGGSERFGEELNDNGWEVAFTSILPDGTFLSKDTVEEYINSILEEAYADDGKVSEDELTTIDAQGRQVGNTFVQGIFAGIDDSQNYDDNGNWAETVGRLMHFVGNFGAKQLADQGIDDANAKLEETKKKIEDVSKGFDDSQKIKDFFDTKGINTDEEIDEFNKVTEGINRADEAIQKWNEHKKEGNETSVSSPQSFEEAWKALDTTEDDNLKNTKKDLLDLAQAGQLSANTLKSVQGAEDYFKAIGLSAQEASNEVNELVNSSQQLSSMQSGITSITGALDTKASEGMVSADKLSGFDVSLRGLETWDKFEETMGDTNSSMEDCKKAANELATEYVNSNNFLSQLTDANKDYYISQLENMGVTNATEVVNASLVNSENALAVAQSEVTSLCNQQTDAKKKSYAASIDLSNATAAELQYLYNEANASGVASSGLRQLLASKLNANNVAIASASDCTALAQIYSSSESTKQSFKSASSSFIF